MIHSVLSRSVFLAFLGSVLCFGAAVHAQEPVHLVDPAHPARDWTFDNGREFPGATGDLTEDAATMHESHASLKLQGDFTKGGNYVQAGRKIDQVDILDLSLWLKAPDTNQLTIRINDASGQTHQINLKVEAQPGWQQIVLPLRRFFDKRGQADAVTTIARYESWGGAKDGAWHGPATAIYVLLGRHDDHAVHTLWLGAVDIIPRPVQVPGVAVKSVVRLDESADGATDWHFTRGEEFPGAKGSFGMVPEGPAAGETSLKLAGDFTGGGAYVAAVRDLQSLGASELTAVHLKAKSANVPFIGIQLVDGSGQTHQRKDIKVIADGQWHELDLKPTDIAGGEHWGGANDGQWHGPARQMAISLGSGADEKTKQPVLFLADIRAEVLLPVFVQPPAFQNDFETGAQLPADWVVEGTAAIDASTAFHGTHSLELSRTVENVNHPCSVTSPVFKAASGQWEISLAVKSDLQSPDDSYNGVVTLECLDGAGHALENLPLAELFRQHDWQPIKKRVELPAGTATARFHAQLNKCSGRFWLDDLSAAYLAPAVPKEDRIARLLFSTGQVGNLLLPTDPRRVNLTVEALKPLPDDQRTVTCQLRDYWGAEQAPPVNVTLQRGEKRNDRFIYEAALDLSAVPLEIGRYYELQASIPQTGDEPFRNYTSFAILPEAETKRYKPEEIPFTSRNWDNRIPEYIQPSDRLGIRVCGLWGGWSAKPPYKPEAPGLEQCQKLGMGWLTNTPIASIEGGNKEYDETALRTGVRNLIQQYGSVRPMIINLGNEPHGAGERVRANVEAYRIVYEEIKKTDPSIFVVGSSMGPEEEYFQAGFGKWCDAYDFHIYEEYQNVRAALDKYHQFFKQYGSAKPIWSTELGLNSAGQTRYAVASELIRKFATFFAAGGSDVSWFGLLYPDPDAKSFGSSGDSHNVFDCRYNRYCPRLDAVAYYDAVNAIAIKKFVTEQQYAGGLQDILFRDRDNRCLQVLWQDHGRADVSLPLPGVKEVQVIRIDGSRHTLNAEGKAITLTVSEDPLLVLYEGGPASLPQTLNPPDATLDQAPRTLPATGPSPLRVILNQTPAESVHLVAPPFWTVKQAPAAKDQQGRAVVEFSVTPPPASSVREADFTITLGNSAGAPSGELYFRAPLAK